MTATSVRHPAVAGRFYPRDPAVLSKDIRSYLSQNPNSNAVSALGCIVPHAGYMFSGHVAGAVFAELEVPELCFVLCPNHTGAGRVLAIVSEGEWETPLGNVPIDGRMAEGLRQRCPLLQEDLAAHRSEHAIEVELPFLQMQRPNLRFVPIALGRLEFEVLEKLGEAIAEVISAQGQHGLIVASSDMNHYESDTVTRVKDRTAIEAILRLDPRGLHDVVTQQHVTMCGYGPTVAMLVAAKKLGAKSAQLVKYATSGDISGDRNSVVGYAGIVVR
jgi:AmmeMemoRadiSam system protein B